MEQLQLTLPELEQEEQKIRENLGGIVKNFVRTGWHLSRIERSGAYKLKGYSSITEYAREIFGMAPDGTSRFIHVYQKYSVSGETPELKAEYKDFNFSQLTEMLQLPEGDQSMIRPETKREDIRALKKFNKQSEHNPNNLMNWQQEPDDIIREAVREFFKHREKDLNRIYEQYGIGPHQEETVKSMARFLYHEKKKKFQTDKVFMILYPDQVFIKSSDGELYDITWTEFFQTMGYIFDGAAAGADTWENYFNPDSGFGEQIPRQDNIMNHPEYLPGKLHGRKFEHCMYFAEEDCISEECKECRKKFAFEQQEARKQAEQKNGRCLYRPESPCTLTAEQKATPGDGENCEEKCCWNCSEKEECKYECNVSANRGGTEETKPEENMSQEKELKKPDEEEREYLESAARRLINGLWDWMRENHANRVADVMESPNELKKKLGPNNRTWWFKTEKGTAHINMFDDYVQLWDEESNHLGDYDWFYLAAAIQGMWNVVSLEKTQERMNPLQKETEISELLDSENSQIAPAQIDVWPVDLADIPVPSLITIKDYLEEEEQTLRDYLECEGLPEKTVLRQQLKVAGLRIIRNLAGDALETEDEIVQPELPKLRNNDERKEWLHNYKSWPLRHTDTYTGAKYYEYRFKNGAVLIAEEWKSGGNEHIPEFETAYLHLVGGPEPPKGLNGTGKWNTHKTFRRHPECETELVEFLKEVQKDGK